MTESCRWDELRAFLATAHEKGSFDAPALSGRLILLINDAPLVKQLISMGANINLVNEEGISAVHSLIRDRPSDCIDKIECLVQNGLNLELPAYNGWRPLHEAAYRNAYRAAAVLIEHGADVNSGADSWHRETPLMVAALGNSFEMARLLLERGADPNMKNRFGRTARNYVRWIFGWRIRGMLKTTRQPEAARKTPEKIS